MQDVAADLDDCNIVIVGIGVIFFGGRIRYFWCFVFAVRRQSEGGSGYSNGQVCQGDVRGGGALGCWRSWCSTSTRRSRAAAAMIILLLQLPLQLRKRDCTVQVFQTDDALVCHHSIF